MRPTDLTLSAALLAVSVAGCLDQEPGPRHELSAPLEAEQPTWTIDPGDCPDAWVQATRRGAHVWNDHLGYQAFSFGDGGAMSVRLVCDRSRKGECSDDYISTWVASWPWKDSERMCYPADAEVTICERTWETTAHDWRWDTAMAHELGHVLGIVYHTDRGLMAGSRGDRSAFSEPPAIDAITAEQLDILDGLGGQCPEGSSP